MKYVIASLLAILVLFVLLGLFSVPWAEIPFFMLWDLLTGWASFLIRSGQQMTWNLDAVATGLVLSVAILLIAQRMGRSFNSRWSWRWSAMVLGGLFWIFAVTIGASGLVTSAREFANTRPKVVNRSMSTHVRMLMEAQSYWSALYMANSDPDQLWRSPGKHIDPPYITNLLEQYQIIPIRAESGRVTHVIFMLRADPPLAEKRKLALVDSSGSARLYPIEDLQSILANPRKAPADRQ